MALLTPNPIGTLPVETLQNIWDHLPKRTKDFLALALTCKHFGKMVTPMIFKKMVIRDTQTVKLWATSVTDNATLALHVRAILIRLA